MAVSALSKEARDLMRKAMQQLTKEEYVHILLNATQCLRQEPGYTIKCPLLMMGDREATGNIRKAMPAWAKHEGLALVITPNARHAANLDQPAIFHSTLLDFLQRTLA